MAVIKVGRDDLRDRDMAVSELKEYFSALGARKGRDITYNVRTYGCQLNEADSEKLHGMLKGMGLSKKEDESAPDVVVLNTCAIRENAEDRLFGNLGEFKADKKRNKDMIIIICGCLATTSAMARSSSLE